MGIWALSSSGGISMFGCVIIFVFILHYRLVAQALRYLARKIKESNRMIELAERTFTKHGAVSERERAIEIAPKGDATKSACADWSSAKLLNPATHCSK
jgi:hypothetical protein